MVYVMSVYTDGGCRRNGQPNAIGAAAAVFRNRWGRWGSSWTRILPQPPPPTNQRAEITAIILALQFARDKFFEDMKIPRPRLCLVIHSDSKYAVNCMTTWRHKWENNGWTNAAGYPVVNQNLLMEAIELQKQLEEIGHVSYSWIPRAENERADELCNRALDEL